MKQRIRILLRFLPCVIGPSILIIPMLIKGRALYWGTPALQFIPWRMYALHRMLQGVVPLWNNLNGMGAPLIANLQLAFFYPPTWLAFLAGALGEAPWMAWTHTLLILLHLIWGGIGMAKFVMKLGLGDLAQAVCSLSFSLCGYLVARLGFFSMIWTVIWLPWILLAIEQMITREKALYKPPSGIGRWIDVPLLILIAMMLLAGHAQLSWYILLYTAAWGMFRGWQQGGLKKLAVVVTKFCLACLLAAALSAIQLMPTAEYLFQSQRSTTVDYESGMAYSFWPWRFLTLFTPDLFGNPGLGDYWGYATYWEDAIYIGFLPITLAISTLRFLGKKPISNAHLSEIKPVIRFLWLGITITVPIAIGWYSPIFPFLYRYIPTFNMFQGPARFMIWLEISIILLAGIGVELWRPATGKGLYWIRLSTAGAFSITIGALTAWAFMGNIRPSFIRALAILGAWALGTGFLALSYPKNNNGSGRLIWGIAMIVWVGLDLLTADWFLNPAVSIQFYSSRAYSIYDLKAELGEHRLFIDNKDEYLLKFTRFFRFKSFLPDEDPIGIRSVELPNINILDDIASVNNFDPLLPGRYERLMKTLGELPNSLQSQWLALLDVGLVERVDQQDATRIKYEKIPEPTRFYWSTCPIFVHGGNEAFSAIQQQVLAGTFQKENQVILEDPKVNSSSACSYKAGQKIISLIRDNSIEIVFAVDTNKSGWLVVADTWYPGWKANVDDKPVPIARANYMFRAVEVPEGNHIVKFIYRPFSFYLGIALSSLGLVFVLSLINLKRTA